MASPLLRIGRFSLKHHFYALTMVVRNRRRIFANTAAALSMSRELAPDAPGMRFVPLAWTVMPDHVHLLVELGDTPLPRSMQILKSRSSRILGGLGLAGRVWQAGYYDHCLRGDEDLRMQARYILENPLRADLVTSAQDYPYSWSVWGKSP